jgi:hypothetical protein
VVAQQRRERWLHGAALPASRKRKSMKVFTFFYNRYDTATTSRALADCGIPHYVMIHSQSDLEKFKAGKTIHGQPVVTNNVKGLTHQRNSALEMMEKGEWAAFLSDDFIKIRSFPYSWIVSKTMSIEITDQNQEKFRLKKKHDISLAEMFRFFPKLIEIAEKNNIHLIGFGLHENPRNLKNKFSTRGLADGRFWLVKKNSYKFDPNVQSIDDYAWTAENLVRHKNVLILNWTLPFFGRYTPGGYGTRSDRTEMRKKECEYLVKKYDPILRFAEKVGHEKGTHIKLVASDGNILAARKRFGL